MKSLQYITSAPLSKKVFWLIMLVFGTIFYTTFIANHYYFRTYTFDYGLYDYSFWDYAHFHISPSPIYYLPGGGRMSFMHEHFSFVLMYFVPLYWLLGWLTGSYTLMIIQVTMILLSAWATYRLVKLKTNHDWLAVISVLYYFLLQGRYSSFSSDCNIYTLAFCFVPLFLLCFELHKYGAAFFLLILFLFSREDMPLYAIFIFIVLLTWHWKEKKIVRYCLWGIVLSVGCFILIFKLLIPIVNTAKVQYDLFQYSALGNTPGEALLYCIKHPINTFKLFYENQVFDPAYDGVKKEFYIVYLISGGFLLFLRPRYLIWFLPIVAQKMFNDIPVRWSITGYYCDSIVTLLPISVFLIISIFKVKWIRYSLAIMVCILALSVTWHEMDTNNRVMWDNTLKANIFTHNFFHADFNAAKIDADMKLIPPDAKVCASSSMLPHLAERESIYEFPHIQDAEYLAILTSKDNYMITEKNYSHILDSCVMDPSWKMVAYDPPFLLMKKKVPGK